MTKVFKANNRKDFRKQKFKEIGMQLISKIWDFNQINGNSKARNVVI